MELLVLILKKTSVLEELLRQLALEGVKGATVVSGTGMAEALMDDDILPVFGMLRYVFAEAEREPSKVVMMVLKDETMIRARRTIKKVVGDLSEPNTGIMFTVPVTYVEGLGD